MPKSASSILQALSCRFFFQLQFNCLCVSSFHDLFVFRLVQKSPPGFFQTGSGALSAAPSTRAFDATNCQAEKSPKALCTSKVILYLHFLEITSLLGLLNFNRHNQQDRACRIKLADLGLNFHRKIGPATGVIGPTGRTPRETGFRPSTIKFSTFPSGNVENLFFYGQESLFHEGSY